MENKQELQDLMSRLEEQAKRQAKFAKWQCLIAAVCCVIFLAAALVLVPRIVDLSARADAVVRNLESITAELEEVDFKGIAENLDALVINSQTSLQEATAKLNGIDLESLNQAIQDLAAVVSPLARLFGR